MSLKNRKYTILDTTLRDGEQGEGISFTVKDKLKITQLLDELGIDYIEGGWPGSNPKAVEYFKAVQKLNLKNAKIAAFSSTRRADKKITEDANIAKLLEVNTPVVVIFGKSWDFHVKEALKISLDENLKLISDTVKYLKEHNKEVIYDAEHFFDGYKHNAKYALKTLEAAEKAGADILCLCDTNGGTLPSESGKIIKEIVKAFPKTVIGIHPHNDGGVAVANGIAAVEAGATHIQGTLNGYGERCGNMNLSTIIPNLVLKMGIPIIEQKQLITITPISHHLDEIANLAHQSFAPYVGRSSFAHKAGVHVNAVMKHPETYEHVSPEKVGNNRKVVISELSGLSNLMYKANEFGIEIKNQHSPEMKKLVQDLKEMEHYGYQFEEAEASFELLMRRTLKQFTPLIKLERFRIINEKSGSKTINLEASVKAKVGEKKVHIVSEGNGPVSALDGALRKALETMFPEIKEIKLTDFKVRVLNSKEGTSAKVRVLIQWEDKDKEWGTVGVSENIIEASWQALVDSYEYRLMREKK
jgi:2-isopropylmalate synthase